MFVTFAIALVNPLDHPGQRSAGKKNLVHASLLHHALVVVCNRAAAAAEYLDIVGPAFLQLFNDLGKKLDVSAVVARNADRAHVFLNGRAHDVLRVAMIPEINDLDAVADELKIDRVDRAVMPVANRDSSEDSDRRWHGRKT